MTFLLLVGVELSSYLGLFVLFWFMHIVTRLQSYSSHHPCGARFLFAGFLFRYVSFGECGRIYFPTFHKLLFLVWQVILCCWRPGPAILRSSLEFLDLFSVLPQPLHSSRLDARGSSRNSVFPLPTQDFFSPVRFVCGTDLAVLCFYNFGPSFSRARCLLYEDKMAAICSGWRVCSLFRRLFMIFLTCSIFSCLYIYIGPSSDCILRLPYLSSWFFLSPGQVARSIRCISFLTLVPLVPTVFLFSMCSMVCELRYICCHIGFPFIPSFPTVFERARFVSLMVCS